MATTATTRVNQETAFTPTLFLAFELGVNKWKLGFTTGAAQRPRERQVPAGDCHTVLEEIRRAKSRFGLPEAARVVSCYEAGRDGFWLHRFLLRQGVENAVVDSASIAVNRPYRRAKTDRLDVHKLLTMRLWHSPGVARGCRDPARSGPPVRRRAAAHRLARSPQAGVAEGPAAHSADREPGGRAAHGVTDQ
jgi:transposase